MIAKILITYYVLGSFLSASYILIQLSLITTQ